VIYLKPGAAKNFVVIDAAMNDLIRPTLYEAHHDILPVRLAEPDALKIVATWSGGLRNRRLLALGRNMPGTEVRRSAGDHDRGRLWRGAIRHLQHPRAYSRGAGQDDQYAVVRPRIEVDALIAMDKVAPWL